MATRSLRKLTASALCAATGLLPLPAFAATQSTPNGPEVPVDGGVVSPQAVVRSYRGTCDRHIFSIAISPGAGSGGRALTSIQVDGRDVPAAEMRVLRGRLSSDLSIVDAVVHNCIFRRASMRLYVVDRRRQPMQLFDFTVAANGRVSAIEGN